MSIFVMSVLDDDFDRRLRAVTPDILLLPHVAPNPLGAIVSAAINLRQPLFIIVSKTNPSEVAYILQHVFGEKVLLF